MNSNFRTRKTAADVYFQTHGMLPKPSVMHAVLPLPSPCAPNNDNGNPDSSSRRRILVIGDVHGCYDEMIRLVNKAVMEENHGLSFAYVILVGDLCNKGPLSASVVRHVRAMQNNSNNKNNIWLSVRGNHDDGALKAALGDVDRRKKKKYRWVTAGEQQEQSPPPPPPSPTTQDFSNGGRHDDDDDSSSSGNNNINNMVDRVVLSDDDVIWMSELPYTIRIPAAFFNNNSKNKNANANDDVDTVIVHAGFLPNVDTITDQSIETMTTLRDVLEEEDGGGGSGSSRTSSKSYPWASRWNGPYRVIFGHDARRGLQCYPSSTPLEKQKKKRGGGGVAADDACWAIGLDTGACYGKLLTGIILPERKLVQVDSQKIYCPIDDD